MRCNVIAKLNCFPCYSQTHSYWFVASFSQIQVATAISKSRKIDSIPFNSCWTRKEKKDEQNSEQQDPLEDSSETMNKPDDNQPVQELDTLYQLVDEQEKNARKQYVDKRKKQVNWVENDW